MLGISSLFGKSVRGRSLKRKRSASRSVKRKVSSRVVSKRSGLVRGHRRTFIRKTSKKTGRLSWYVRSPKTRKLRKVSATVVNKAVRALKASKASRRVKFGGARKAKSRSRSRSKSVVRSRSRSRSKSRARPVKRSSWLSRLLRKGGLASGGSRLGAPFGSTRPLRSRFGSRYGSRIGSRFGRFNRFPSLRNRFGWVHGHVPNLAAAMGPYPSL